MKLRTWWTLPAGLVLVLAVMAIALVNAAPAAAQTQGSTAGFASTPTPTRTRTPTPTPTFTPAPPPPPALLAPPDSGRTTGHDSGPLGMPTFQWVMPPFASIAHIQISNTPGFSTVLVDVDTRASTYTPTAVWLDGAYYWRVKAGIAVSGGSLWGPYSETYSFTKNWSDSDTIRPDLLLPEANVQRSSFGAGDFSWTAVPGAAGYTFEIAADTQFSSVVYKADTLLPQHTPTERLASNVYYWRVTPFAYYGGSTPRVAGTPSETRSFSVNWSTPPQLIAPATDFVTAFAPRFQWQAVEGAKSYQLQVSTDAGFGGSTCNNGCTPYATSNTDFTPEDAYANDQDYYWRVRALDAETNPTNWSEIRKFSSKWNFQPRLLTPLNNEIMLSYPFFSWEPVPGAQKYQIQIDESDQFAAPLIGDATLFNVTTYTQPQWQTFSLNADFFWRVRAINATNTVPPTTTPWSETRSFRFSSTVGPNLIYPPFTYEPDSANLPVHRTTTIAWPVFVWDTAHARSGKITVAPDRYVLEVDDDPAFGSPNFSLQTRTLAAAPVWDSSPGQPLQFKNLQDGMLYFWRVRAYIGAGQLGETKVWQMRYSHTPSEVAMSDVIAPTMPRQGFEAVDAPPVLGWQPVVSGGVPAGSYHVQVSKTQDFSPQAIVDEAHAQFINYVPWQGRTSTMPPGTYWWRVRAESVPGAPAGDWSTPRSFNLSFDIVAGNPYDLPLPPYPASILSPTEWSVPTFSQVAVITATSGDQFQLNSLHVMMDRSYVITTVVPNSVNNLNWVLAFNINPTGQPVRYGIYIDRNHFAATKTCAEAQAAGEQDAGATGDPAGQNIAFNPMYAPEYVIYVDWDGSAITAVNYYRWNGVKWDPKCQWDPPRLLTSIGGLAWYDAPRKTIELLVPSTAFSGADDDFAGSFAMSLFSTTSTPGDGMHQSVPQQGMLPGSTANTIDSPVFVSDMLMPLTPFDVPFNNPTVFQDMPPVRWRMPLFDSVDGYRVQIALDARFTQSPFTWETYESYSSPLFAMIPASFQSGAAHNDNESYYWRVQIRHEMYNLQGQYDYGPWSPPMRFKLDSRRVGNPRLSTGPNAFMTPTFEWDRVEGAAGYVLQIDDDSKFGSPLIDVQVDGTSYTPPENGAYSALKSLTTYYWRVAMRRSGTVFGQWSDPMPFVKTSVAPTPLSPLTTIPTTLLNNQPTFTWAVVLTPTGTPRLATAQYRLQVDDDPSFGSPKVDTTTTATSYTAPRGKSLADGTWYWRVAIMEASGQSGPFSTPQMFVKQYPLPGMVAPASGGIAGEIPAFVWQIVPGAAYYKFSVANNDGFTGATTTNTMQRTYTPTAALKNGLYYWRIQMYDLDDVAGPIVAGRFNLGYSLFLPSLSKSK